MKFKALIIAMLLASCSSTPSESAVQTVFAQTAKANSTQTIRPLSQTSTPSVTRTPTIVATQTPYSTPNINPIGCIVSIPSNSEEWYAHFCLAGGIAILASDNVPHDAIQQAYSLVMHMYVQIPVQMEELADEGLRIVIYEDWLEDISQVPDICDVNHGKGVFCPEEPMIEPMIVTWDDSLLCSTDEGWGQFTIHELAHALLTIVAKDDSDLNTDLVSAFNNAKAEGLWKDSYSMQGVTEYWAEGVRAYFRVYWEKKGGEPYKKLDLASYDPMLFGLISEFFGPLTWDPGCQAVP